MNDRAVPNLPSRDFDTTIAFYGRFGFTAAFRDATWLVLRHGDLELEFFPFPDLNPEQSSFRCSIRVDELDSLYEQIRSTGVQEGSSETPRLMPVTMQPWGQRVGFLIDPDGTQLQLIGNVVG